MAISDLEEAQGAIFAAQEKATESGQLLTEAMTNAEAAAAKVKEANEDAEAAATELANALEKLGDVAGSVLAAQEWMTQFGAEMAEGMPNSSMVQILSASAEKAGEVINEAEAYGTTVEEAQERSEQLTSDLETSATNTTALQEGIDEAGKFAMGLVQHLGELHTELGSLA